MKQIAICIVTYNRKNELLVALDSILKQSYSDFDIFIWDNCSTDGTEIVIKSIYPSINYIFSNKNLGGSGGYSSLLKHCYEKGYNFFWCLDDDATLKENCLEEIIKAFKELSKNCIIGSKIISDPNGSADFWPIQEAYDPVTKKINQFSSEEINEIINNKKNIYPTVSVALLGLFTNRETISIVGFPKENLFISSDDVEFCLRAWTKGIPVYKVFNAVIVHPPLITKKINFLFKKIEIILMSDFKLFYFIRNNVYIAKIYFTKWDFIKLSSILVVTIFANAFCFSKQPIKTIYTGLKSLLIGFNFK